MNRQRIRNVPELSDEELRQFTWTESSKPGGGQMEPPKIERNWRLLKKYYAALREMKGDDKKAVSAVVMAGVDFGLTRDIVHLSRRQVHAWLLSQQPVAKPAAPPEGWRGAMSPEQSGHLGGKFSGISKRLDELDALYTQTDDRILEVKQLLDNTIHGTAQMVADLETKVSSLQHRAQELIGTNANIDALIKRVKELENGTATEQEQAKSWIPGRGR